MLAYCIGHRDYHYSMQYHPLTTSMLNLGTSKGIHAAIANVSYSTMKYLMVSMNNIVITCA